MADSNGLTNKEENRFWLQVFSDKSNVLKQRFAPENTNEISQLKLFASRYFELAKQARKDLTEEQTSQINIDALRATDEFKHFTVGILRRQLLEDFYISITPMETNSIIDLTNMYLYILGEFVKKKTPNIDPTYFLGFWLRIIYPQTLFIENNVGLYYSEFREKIGSYSNIFLNDEKRIQENTSFMQNGIPDFPMNKGLISEIYQHLSSYESFIVDTIILVQQKKIPSSLTPVFLDHLYRIVCYVAMELSKMLGIKRPVCDPGGPALVERYTII